MNMLRLMVGGVVTVAALVLLQCLPVDLPIAVDGLIALALGGFALWATAKSPQGQAARLQSVLSVSAADSISSFREHITRIRAAAREINDPLVGTGSEALCREIDRICENLRVAQGDVAAVPTALAALSEVTRPFEEAAIIARGGRRGPAYETAVAKVKEHLRVQIAVYQEVYERLQADNLREMDVSAKTFNVVMDPEQRVRSS